MGAKSRRKGKEGELDVARRLYEAHFGCPPPPDRTVFVRTKPGVRQHEGDLIVPEDFPFFVEVKNRSICLSHLLRDEWGEIIKTTHNHSWPQCRIPLLIFKVHREWWVLTRFVDVPLRLAYLNTAVSTAFFVLLPLKQFCQWWRQKREEAKT